MVVSLAFSAATAGRVVFFPSASLYP